jgi:hypothetical protein
MFARRPTCSTRCRSKGLKGSVFQYYRQAVLPTPQFRAINESSSSGTRRHHAAAGSDRDHRPRHRRRPRDRRPPRHRAAQLRRDDGPDRVRPAFRHHGHQGRPVDQPARVQRPAGSRAAKYSRTTHNSAASGGAALSLLKLDQAIAQVNNPTHIIVPYLSKALWIQAARTTSLSGFVMQTWDEVGGRRSVTRPAAPVRLPEGRSPLHARLQRSRERVAARR